MELLLSPGRRRQVHGRHHSERRLCVSACVCVRVLLLLLYLVLTASAAARSFSRPPAAAAVLRLLLSM